MKKRSKISAFTLVEVLVAMLVLAIGLLGLAGITVIVLRSNTLSQQISEATTIASDLMENLKRQTYSSLPDCVAANTISTCSSEILMNAGITSNTLYPPLTSAVCKVTGTNVLFAGSSIDFVSANLVGEAANVTSVCDTNLSIPARKYVRYYRSYASSTGASDRVIVVVVLWKDKFGKPRQVHLTTTRTQ